MAKRLRQVRDLQRGVAPGRVERPFGGDCGEADPHRGRDLPMGIAGGDEVQKASTRSTRFASRAFAAARASARREREEGSSIMHGLRRRNLGSLKRDCPKVRFSARKSSCYMGAGERSVRGDRV